jgi:hypothetical protein
MIRFWFQKPRWKKDLESAAIVLTHAKRLVDEQKKVQKQVDLLHKMVTDYIIPDAIPSASWNEQFKRQKERNDQMQMQVDALFKATQDILAIIETMKEETNGKRTETPKV